MIAPKVALFPGMVSVSHKEAVEREGKAEPAPRTAKRYYSWTQKQFDYVD